MGDDRYRYIPLQPLFPEVNPTLRTGQVLSVLCVFENPAFLDRICSHLEENGDIMADIAISVEDALHLMRYVLFDAIVTDYFSGQSETNGFLKIVRRFGNPVPFIYFTPSCDPLTDMEAREYRDVYTVEWQENPLFGGFDDLYLSVKQAVATTREPGKTQKGVFL